MSAIVCGKRSFFEELPTTPPSVSKRIRCSSSPIRFSPPRPTSTTSPSPSSPSSSPSSFAAAAAAASAHSSRRSSLVDHLFAIFPDMEKQVLERALEECGDDIDSAIKSLYELRLGSADANLCSNNGVATEANIQLQPQGVTINGEVASAEDRSAPNNLSMDGGDWVELFVREMMSASNMDDARARASRALEVLEKSIIARTGVEAAQSLTQENMMLKEQVETLIQENTVLKRAVSIQHERQREFEDRNQELQHLKQMVSQYQEQLRTLEVNNYALTMHLRQAQQGGSIPGRFHPDVF